MGEIYQYEMSIGLARKRAFSREKRERSHGKNGQKAENWRENAGEKYRVYEQEIRKENMNTTKKKKLKIR